MSHRRRHGQDVPAPVVLASQSATRAALLRGAGVPFTADAAAIDEAGARDTLRGEGANAAGAASALAALKAVQVSGRHRGALVVGADQILDCAGVWFDKPPDRARARADLMVLRGRGHRQHSAVCVARDGAVLWHHGDCAELVMRRFSERFIDAYLAAAGDSVLASVGAYRLERTGAQLFSEVRGDYFTILGLPLLPLLEFLRGHGVVVE